MVRDDKFGIVLIYLQATAKAATSGACTTFLLKVLHAWTAVAPIARPAESASVTSCCYVYLIDSIWSCWQVVRPDQRIGWKCMSHLWSSQSPAMRTRVFKPSNLVVMSQTWATWDAGGSAVRKTLCLGCWVLAKARRSGRAFNKFEVSTGVACIC